MIFFYIILVLYYIIFLYIQYLIKQKFMNFDFGDTDL